MSCIEVVVGVLTLTIDQKYIRDILEIFQIYLVEVFGLGLEHFLCFRVPYCGIVEDLGGCWLISR